MKLPYDVAFALQIAEAILIIWLKMYAGRRPKLVLIGTLRSINISRIQRLHICKAYQTKLLNPRTKIATPVNWIASAKLQ